MRMLQCYEWNLVSAGSLFSSSSDSPPSDVSQSLRVYVKRDAFYGALGVALLMSPGGWTTSLCGAMIGTALGAGYGYLEWLIYQ